MKKTIFTIIIAVVTISMFAQEDLVTDRPDQTESAVTVPLNSLQIETGFSIENDKWDQFENKNISYNSTLLRYGIIENFELRIGFGILKTEQKTKWAGLPSVTKDYRYLPLSVGGKYHFTDNNENSDFAILIMYQNILDTKLSYKNISNDLNIIGAFSHNLCDKVSMGYNFGGIYNIDDNSMFFIYSIAAGISLTDKLSFFVEPYGTLANGDHITLQLDAGFTYLVLNNLQIDISGGIGITDVSPDNFISFGLSYRLPN
jgi:Putative MetA-pathway of phenol degradation